MKLSSSLCLFCYNVFLHIVLHAASRLNFVVMMQKNKKSKKTYDTKRYNKALYKKQTKASIIKTSTKLRSLVSQVSEMG